MHVRWRAKECIRLQHDLELRPEQPIGAGECCLPVQTGLWGEQQCQEFGFGEKDGHNGTDAGF